MTKPLTASIIIATANRADSLDRTLHSLRQLRYPYFEVLVVDGPSVDHSAQVAMNHKDFIHYIPCTKPNLSAARNIGIAHAKGDVIIFIDDDAIPEPDWLDLLLAPYADPDIVSVGGFIRDHTGIAFQAKYMVCDRLGVAEAFEDASEFIIDADHFLSLTGTNFSTRRKNLLEIGGFDEEFIYYLDETDVNMRMHDRGWRAVVVPKAEIHHKFAPSHMRTAARVPRTMYPQLRSKAYFCVTHGRKAHSLEFLLKYLSDYVELERGWKSDLIRHGMADADTVKRLISEVEQGTVDGVRDAFSGLGPFGISNELAAEGKTTPYKPFPLPLKASKRLRLCMLSQDYPPDGQGGIGQWTRQVATGLAQRGHEVTVITRCDTEFANIDFIDGVWVHRIKAEAASKNIRAAMRPIPESLVDYSAALATEIMRVQERRQFQVISGPIFDFESAASLAQTGIPTVVSLHTTYKLGLPFKPDWSQNAEYYTNHVVPAIAAEKRLLETAPHILANSHAVVRDIEAAYGVNIPSDRLVTVPHGFADLSIGVKPFPKNDKKLRILFVGRLEPRKGADLVLQVIPDLLERHKEIEFHIVGDDKQEIDGQTYRSAFEKKNKGRPDVLTRTIFHGAVTREDLLRHYASCDLFVAPSRYESFGLIFVEAMMFGKPSVAIDVGGVSEVVTNGSNAILIERDDPELLADALNTLIIDPKRRSAYGRSARKSFESQFDATHMIIALEAYYRSIAVNTEVKTGHAPVSNGPVGLNKKPHG